MLFRLSTRGTASQKWTCESCLRHSIERYSCAKHLLRLRDGGRGSSSSRTVSASPETPKARVCAIRPSHQEWTKRRQRRKLHLLESLASKSRNFPDGHQRTRQALRADHKSAKRRITRAKYHGRRKLNGTFKSLFSTWNARGKYVEATTLDEIPKWTLASPEREKHSDIELSDPLPSVLEESPCDTLKNGPKLFKSNIAAVKQMKAKERVLAMNTISADHTTATSVASGKSSSIPSLKHRLDQVLFNPGVFYLQDPRSRVFNFDPSLQMIMPVDQFDFNALNEYITSSRDLTLEHLARERKKSFCGSSSSMTGILSHFHFLLSDWRPINTDALSSSFTNMPRTFTSMQKLPTAVYLRFKDGVYAIDADKSLDEETVLSLLGRSMEKRLTLPSEEYERYRKDSSHNLPRPTSDMESYHYSECCNLLMRSQLDCKDDRLPGTGVFDLKTRAVIAVRMDVANADKYGAGYQIKHSIGVFESFEREYYDMMRAAFLKYSLQVRMGKMDGIFVAYHNTERIFGFQYISLQSMDEAIHGGTNGNRGDREYHLSLKLLSDVLDTIATKYPGESLRLHFETKQTKKSRMIVFAEIVSDEEIERNQSSGSVVSLEQLRLQEETDLDKSGRNSTVNDESSVEESSSRTKAMGGELEDDDEGYEEEEEEKTSNTDVSDGDNIGSLKAFELKVQHLIDDVQVDTISDVDASQKWEVNYTLSQIESHEAKRMFEATKKRRTTGLTKSLSRLAKNGVVPRFLQKLRSLSADGRKWAERQAEKDGQKDRRQIVYKDSSQNLTS